MSLRVRYALAMLVLIGAVARAQEPTPKPAPPAPVDGGGVMGLTLQTQLEKGLRARRPVEFVYIDEIIKLVEKGELPRLLVTTTYQWAQRQPSRRLQYFQFALQARVRRRRLNVVLPNLRDQAVGISNNGGEHGVNTGP